MGFLVARSSQPIGQQVGQNTYGGSTYGQTIPTVYGCCRVPTNLMWLDTVQASTSQSGGSGKGAPSPTTTTTAYSANFAVEIANGLAVGIAQIWADSTLVYNASDTATASDLIAAEQFMAYLSNYAGVHLGSPTQVPDALMGQALAPGLNYTANSYVNYVNVCPAYRGKSYMVFNNYPFGTRSPRVPSIEVELCTGPNAVVTTLGSGVKQITRGIGYPIDMMIQGILTEAGIDIGNIYTDPALNSILVPGLICYGDQRQRILDELLQGFDVGFAESGYTLTFFPLYRNVSLNIPVEIVAATTEGRKGNMADPYPFVDTKEFDLPYQVNINFKNNGLAFPEGSTKPQTSYDDCTQGYQRFYGIANQIINMDLSNWALDVTTASRIANKQLYKSWVERLALTPLKLPRQYINMEPNDVWSTTYGGVTLNFRNTKVTIGRDFVVEVEAVQYDQSTATSVINGATPFGNVTQESAIGLNPILYPMNLPALQALQAVQLGFYVAGAWSGGQGQPGHLYASVDNFGHSTPEATLFGSALTGTVIGTLGNADFYRIDTTNSLVVLLDNSDKHGVIANASLNDLANNQNLLYVGTMTDNTSKPYNQFEILQAETVVFNSDRTQATFTNLLRGRKGTENYVGSHVGGEKFVFLSGPGIVFIPGSSGWANNSGFELELVPPGVVSDVALAAFKTFNPNWNNMVCLSPKFFTGNVTSNPYEVQFQWYRRTRYDAPILQPGGVPVGETVESYQLQFYSPSNVFVLGRTYTPSVQLTDPVTMVYTQAMRNSDFGSTTFNLTGYTMYVAQISTITGAGDRTLNAYTFTQ